MNEEEKTMTGIREELRAILDKLPEAERGRLFDAMWGVLLASMGTRQHQIDKLIEVMDFCEELKGQTQNELTMIREVIEAWPRATT